MWSLSTSPTESAVVVREILWANSAYDRCALRALLEARLKEFRGRLSALTLDSYKITLENGYVHVEAVLKIGADAPIASMEAVLGPLHDCYILVLSASLDNRLGGYVISAAVFR